MTTRRAVPETPDATTRRRVTAVLLAAFLLAWGAVLAWAGAPTEFHDLNSSFPVAHTTR